MHRCLYITEVLQAVAASFDTRFREDRMSLACMARTCHGFFDPAIDTLWRTLSSPEALMLLLLAHVRYQHVMGLRLLTAPSEAEWRRFMSYARRVRTLNYPVSTAQEKHPRMSWSELMEQYPGSQLLPNLHTFNAQCNLDYRHYGVFVRPSIRHLRLEYLEMWNIRHIIPCLTDLESTLETFSLEILCWDTDTEVAKTISDTIARLRAAVSISAHVLEPSCIHRLASLTTLRELSIMLEIPDRATGILPFPALARLVLKPRADDVSLVTSFLRRLAAPSLRAITLAYAVPHTPISEDEAERPAAAYVHAVFIALSRLTQLKSITWSRIAPEPLPSPQHVLNGGALVPLFALDLEMLDMRHLPVELTPADVASFAGAWPNIRTLRMYDTLPRGQYAANPLELSDLLPLARSCAHLHELGLPVHITANTIIEDSTPTTPRTELVALHVVWISPDFAQDAVRFIAHIWPYAAVKCDARDSVYRRLNFEIAKEAFMTEV